jgi:hypothetical protein
VGMPHRAYRLCEACTTIIIVAVMYALTSCALERQSLTAHKLLGKSKEEILLCAGAPLQERREEDLTIWIYYKEASLLDEVFPVSKSSFARSHHGCLARLGLDEGHVVGVEYLSAPASYKGFDWCEQLFEQCKFGDQAN